MTDKIRECGLNINVGPDGARRGVASVQLCRPTVHGACDTLQVAQLCGKIAIPPQVEKDHLVLHGTRIYVCGERIRTHLYPASATPVRTVGARRVPRLESLALDQLITRELVIHEGRKGAAVESCFSRTLIPGLLRYFAELDNHNCAPSMGYRADRADGEVSRCARVRSVSTGPGASALPDFTTRETPTSHPRQRSIELSRLPAAERGACCCHHRHLSPMSR